MYVDVKGSKDQFMKPEILGKMQITVIDAKDGVHYVDMQDCHPGTNSAAEFLKMGVDDIFEVSHMYGYMVRHSAPGYLDATEWVAFTSKKEAMQYLSDYYNMD